MSGPFYHEEEDDELVAARWVLAVDAGLEPGQTEAFHAWLAARPERADLIARQAALQSLAKSARTDARRPTSRRGLLIGGGVAFGAAAIGGAVVLLRPTSSEIYETGVGEVRAVNLADTSRLWLDTRTRVTTQMGRANRWVSLASGRMFVEVAHDAMRPFMVRAGKFEARALGTAFEAAAFPGRTGVAVTEGVVRFTPRDGSAFELGAGQGAWITASGEIQRVSTATPSVAAWREHRMVLSDRRLDAALAELSRYFDQPLTVVDPSLAARRVSLSFSIADLDERQAARIIADAVDADFAARADGAILLRPKLSL
ncbi:FecR domain-containing protein [Caulobacter sp.]|uniref:FecR family protein n=1 Tax=Caulobacter sp. TaxID=78 RepID=UPI001B15EFD5|nr:FecR domain-containing protein [Caulobacter sp.]MBO9545445.1 FecR domain-containing protein [Caulobacter sp.]